MGHITKMSHGERKARREVMVERVKQGRSPKEVAEEFSVTHVTVYKACREWKIKLPGWKVSMEKSRKRRKIVAAYVEQGHSVSETAEKFKLHPSTVRKACGACKVELPALRRGKSMVEYLEQGYSVEETARKYGIQRKSVSRICKKWKIVRRDQEALREELRARRECMAKYVEEGHSVEETAEAFKVADVTVYKACKEWNVLPHSQKDFVEEAQRKRKAMAEYVKQGHDVRETSEEFKVSDVTVYKACKEWKVEVLKEKNRIDEARERREAMAKLVEKGYSVIQVSKRYRVSVMTVYTACKESQVTLPQLRRSLDKLRGSTLDRSELPFTKRR
jgi:transposase